MEYPLPPGQWSLKLEHTAENGEVDMIVHVPVLSTHTGPKLDVDAWYPEMTYFDGTSLPSSVDPEAEVDFRISGRMLHDKDGKLYYIMMAEEMRNAKVEG